jgi:hypothetical protein
VIDKCLKRLLFLRSIKSLALISPHHGLPRKNPQRPPEDF